MPEEPVKLTAEPRTITIGELPHVRSPHFASVYSNFVQASLTPWDIRLTFSEVAEAAPDEGAIIEHAIIVLPPPVAKALTRLLIAQVKNFEEQYGEIRGPKHPDEKPAEAQAENPRPDVDATDKPLAG